MNRMRAFLCTICFICISLAPLGAAKIENSTQELRTQLGDLTVATRSSLSEVVYELKSEGDYERAAVLESVVRELEGFESDLPSITDESIESMRPAMERLMGLSDRLNSEEALTSISSSDRRRIEYLVSPDPEFQAPCTDPNKDARCSDFCPAAGYPGGGSIAMTVIDTIVQGLNWLLDHFNDRDYKGDSGWQDPGLQIPNVQYPKGVPGELWCNLIQSEMDHIVDLVPDTIVSLSAGVSIGIEVSIAVDIPNKWDIIFKILAQDNRRECNEAHWNNTEADVCQLESIAIATEDALQVLQSSLIQHDSDVKTQVQTHDEDVKAALDEIQAKLANLKDGQLVIQELLNTPQGQREEWPVKPPKE